MIKDGLFHSGIIFKDKLDNLALSEKAFRRLINDYPDFEPMDEVYYHLFLLYSRKDDAQRAQQNIENLKSRYPDSRWTAILTDPYFEENARFGEHIEDSLYAATYNAFSPSSSVDTKSLKTPAAFFVVAALLYIVISYTTGVFSRIIGIILLLMFLVYMVITMAQDFNDNLNPLTIEGQYGSLRSPIASSPRYPPGPSVRAVHPRTELGPPAKYRFSKGTMLAFP